MSIAETFHGYIETTQDTLIMFEACRRGLLPRICRRLQEKERRIVRSGSVFVFDERESGIKRWTDGLVWSPSRILGNFLIYRELDKRNNGKKSASPIDRASRSNSSDVESSIEKNKERALVGSLTNSYRFKKNGLIKKTMSIVVNGVSQHMISYYSKEDVLAGRLSTPSSVAGLACLDISPEFLTKQNFRIPPTLDQSFEQYHTHSPTLDHSPHTPGGTLVYPVDTNKNDFPSSSFDHHVRPKIEPETMGARHQPIHSQQDYHTTSDIPGVQHQNYHGHHYHHHHHNSSSSINDMNNTSNSDNINNSNSNHSHTYNTPHHISATFGYNSSLSTNGALDASSAPPSSLRHSPRSHPFISYSSHQAPSSHQQYHSTSHQRQSASSPYVDGTPAFTVPSPGSNISSPHDIGVSMGYHSPAPNGNSTMAGGISPQTDQPQPQQQYHNNSLAHGWNDFQYSFKVSQ